MKKGFKYSMAAIVAASALTPVMASAAENDTVAPGVYNTSTNETLTLPQFQDLSTSAKGKWLGNPDVYVVVDGLAYKGTNIITLSDADLLASGVPAPGVIPPVQTPELKVESVSAINANGVTVDVKELAVDIEGATVEVKDSKGNVVEVEALDLSAGEKAIEFTFVKPVKDEDLTGVWTVDGVEFNLSLANQLATFEETNSQIELYEVLNELGIENVDSANAAAYLQEKQDFLNDLAANDKELTVEAIQTFVDDVNAAQVTDAEKDAAAQAVVKALGNNVQLKAALANKAFTKVNNEWIEDIGVVDGYATELAANLVADGTDTADDVQAQIDAVNEAVIATEIVAVAPSTSVDKAKLAKLKTLIETYAPVNEDNEYVTSANQTALDNIAEQSAVADVLAATTASKFKATVTTLAGIANTPGTSDVIDLEDYVDANGKAYIDTIKDLNSAAPTLTDSDYSVSGKVNLASEIASLILKVNDLQADKGAVTKYEALETATQNVIANATASNKSKYIAALNAVGIKQVSSNSANVAEYIKTDGSTLTADLIEAAAAGVSGTSHVAGAKTAIQGAIDAANLDVVQNADATGIISALNVLELKNVVPANAAKYYADDNGDIAVASDADDVQAAIDQINSDAAIEAAVAAINKAETATQVKTALDTLANEGEVAGYLNVTSADRIFIAEQVLDARDKVAGPPAKEFANETAVGTAVTNATNARTTAIAAVNALEITDELTDIAKALLLVGHESLTGTWDGNTGSVTANDTNIADAFITSVQFDDTGAIVPQYRSIAEIRTALSGL